MTWTVPNCLSILPIDSVSQLFYSRGTFFKEKFQGSPTWDTNARDLRVTDDYNWSLFKWFQRLNEHALYLNLLISSRQ